MQSPWQLYLFCALQLLGFFMSSTLLGRYPCLVYGHKCDDVEAVLSNMSSIWLLSLAVLFFLLTFRNRTNPEKLKRLAYFAIYCTIANVTGLLMIGSPSVAGLMKTGYHVMCVLITLVLFFILASAVSSDEPMVATAPFRENLGLNLKGFVVLYSVLLLVWIFVNADFLSFDSFFDGSEEPSDVAKMCSNYGSVLILENLFVFIYALAYDDDEDREAIAIASVLLNAFFVLETWLMRSMVKTGMVAFMYVQSSIMMVLAIAVVVRYRMAAGSRNGGSGEYLPINE